MMQDVTVMGSAWSKGGEHIDPMSVYKDFEPWSTAKLTVPTGQLYALDTRPNYNITFHNNLNTLDAGKQVGKLYFNGPELVFEGDAAESAKVFIDLVARTFHGRLKEERDAGRQEAEAELDATNRQVEILSDALAESRREVTWGVDWGRAGDKACVSIIKRLPNGKIEVVAVEYQP
jgi:hypothetical protein